MRVKDRLKRALDLTEESKELRKRAQRKLKLAAETEADAKRLMARADLTDKAVEELLK